MSFFFEAVVGRGRRDVTAVLVYAARLAPLLQRGDERVLRQVFRDADVTDDARQAGDEPGGFDPPDRIDGVSSPLVRHPSSAGFRLPDRDPRARCALPGTP